MTDLTIAQLERARRRIGDGNTPPTFSDAELQDNWSDAGEDWNAFILLCYDDLIGNSWKFNDYTQNQTQERKQQIFDNLMKTRKLWQDKVNVDIANALKPSQVMIVGTRRVPPRKFDTPAGESGKEDFDAGSDVRPR